METYELLLNYIYESGLLKKKFNLMVVCEQGCYAGLYKQFMQEKKGDKMMAKDMAEGCQIYTVLNIFPIYTFFQAQTHVCEFLRGFRTLEGKCCIRRLFPIAKASAITLREKELKKYVLKIYVLFTLFGCHMIS